ncbi:unnamed protein product [Triticum turgidum subsp. durum]|uniref:GOLD domain-containing protein n=1 Tax=Triticum turgidum subsp. durum TaxID=4567 RepID=A0A9R0TXW4_TRITD|nr:unnamed protein product [Triticum turgidum subsp. durum]
MARWRPAMLLVAALALAAAAGWRAEALSVTVTDTECIHEFVPYEGDSVSGNFVVVDHDIFWSSDHPGIDLTVPVPEHLDPINVKIAELKEALESVTAEQKYLKARDARHRHTNESTRRRVMFYTMAEYAAFMAASALQVVYIHRLFSKNVGYNRV